MFKQNSSRAWLGATLAVFLAACGGGGGGGGTPAASGSSVTPSPAPATTSQTPSSSVASPTPTPAQDVSTPTQNASTAVSAGIDYYGDSTIWGYKSGVGTQVQNTAPAIFEAALKQYHLPAEYTVKNEGVSNSTACQLLEGADGRHPAWDAQMANSAARIVIINFAINDEWKETLVQYADCLTSLAQIAKSQGKEVIFETPNPTRDSGAEGLDIVVDAMRKVAAAQGAPVIDQYAYLTGYLAGAGIETICPDGVHPTEAVYRMKGEYAAEIFAALDIR